ncbi:MAG TPA: long-chain fatty acid--CoA ligase [Terriglobia bacterium]|nr:long-chain fatty acid--CoA ligase [Terriglobia bacterium]
MNLTGSTVSPLSTLCSLFLDSVDHRPRSRAFLSKSHGVYAPLSSHGALREVARFAIALEQLGVRPGDRVAILSENRLEWALTDYAILGLGAITVPLYPTLPGAEIDLILRDSGAKGIILSTAQQLEKLMEVRPNLPDLRFVISMDQPAAEAKDVQDWRVVLSRGLDREPKPDGAFRERACRVKPEDIASILYTSGTTGNPKGVVLTHANIVSNVLACYGIIPFGQRDTSVSFLPLSHIFERMLDFYAFWQGVVIGYPESMDTLVRNILEVRPTLMAVVPRVLEKVYEKSLQTVRSKPRPVRKLFHWGIGVGRDWALTGFEGRKPPASLRWRHALADKLVCSKVRAGLGGRLRFLISGAAPLSREIAEFFFAVGLPVYEGYGLTETSPVIAVNCPSAVKLGTVGKIIAGVEVKLGEQTMDAEGRIGREILVRGPNVSPGYYQRDEENRTAFVDGWFRTGDLGGLDSEGFLSITGRLKNLFKTSGGKYVAPERLENLFQGHPYVSQIMAVGDSRRFIGALIVPKFALLEGYARGCGIVPKNREELVKHPQVLAFMQQQVDDTLKDLAPFEKIRQIALIPREFSIEAGELSATLKIKRYVVEEHFRETIEEIYRRQPEEQSANA